MEKISSADPDQPDCRHPEDKKELVSIEKRKDGWIKAYDLHYVLEDGSPYTYEMASRRDISDSDALRAPHVDAIQIVPVFADGDVLVSCEFRYPLDSRAYGFCSGLTEDGECVLETAARELAEETELKVVEILGVLPAAYSSDGFTDENLSVVFAIVSGEPSDVHGSEDITSRKVPVSEALTIATSGSNACGARFQLVACLLAALSSQGDVIDGLRRFLAGLGGAGQS